MIVNRREIFQTVKQLRNGQAFTLDEVRLLDAAIDRAMAEAVPVAPVIAPTPAGRTISPKGIALIHSFEQCRLDAYPDPGSRDGKPWTIGWGSTGPGIAKGVRWTQAQADARFAQDIAKFAAGVDQALGRATQNQFDACTSLAYNIGLSAFQRSTVLRLHKAGDYLGAARAFLMWNKNNGTVMRGLTRRRLAESELYSA